MKIKKSINITSKYNEDGKYFFSRKNTECNKKIDVIIDVGIEEGYEEKCMKVYKIINNTIITPYPKCITMYRGFGSSVKYEPLSVSFYFIDNNIIYDVDITILLKIKNCIHSNIIRHILLCIYKSNPTRNLIAYKERATYKNLELIDISLFSRIILTDSIYIETLRYDSPFIFETRLKNMKQIYRLIPNLCLNPPTDNWPNLYSLINLISNCLPSSCEKDQDKIRKLIFLLQNKIVDIKLSEYIRAIKKGKCKITNYIRYYAFLIKMNNIRIENNKENFKESFSSVISML